MLVKETFSGETKEMVHRNICVSSLKEITELYSYTSWYLHILISRDYLSISAKKQRKLVSVHSRLSLT